MTVIRESVGRNCGVRRSRSVLSVAPYLAAQSCTIAVESRDEDPSGVLFRLQSGRAAGEVLSGGRGYQVLEIQDQWYGPESTYFKVRADDGNFYILRNAWSEQTSSWFLEAYRQDSSLNNPSLGNEASGAN